ncbi:hypothetical protein B2M20_17820, partial [Nitrobacter vulgaris]
MEQADAESLVQTVAALSLLPGTVWAQAPSDAEGYYGWRHMMGWGGGYAMIFGPLFMILFLAVLEHFPTGMNRLGFPKRRESDSSCMLAKEASMHG